MGGDRRGQEKTERGRNGRGGERKGEGEEGGRWPS